jgi:hypothetical protein
MIQSKVFKLLKKTTLQNGVVLPEGQELEVVMDVVYVGGYPLPPNMQALVLNWIKNNPNLFADVTRNW